MSFVERRPNWPLRLAAVMVAGGVVAFVALLIHAAATDVLDLDRYEVLHVVTDPATRRHAVVYRHHHADSSAVLDGIWIVDGAAPPLGSREKPAGKPVAVWRGFRPAVHWKDRRVAIAGDVAPENVLAALDVGAECYFDGSDGSRRLQLCIDRTRVTFVRTRL